MKEFNSKSLSDDQETLVFNAFSHERFFDYEDNIFILRRSSSVDKLAVIDEMLSANITELTHRSRQDS